jgi:hypothetical protein
MFDRQEQLLDENQKLKEQLEAKEGSAARGPKVNNASKFGFPGNYVYDNQTSLTEWCETTLLGLKRDKVTLSTCINLAHGCFPPKIKALWKDHLQLNPNKDFTALLKDFAQKQDYDYPRRLFRNFIELCHSSYNGQTSFGDYYLRYRKYLQEGVDRYDWPQNKQQHYLDQFIACMHPALWDKVRLKEPAHGFTSYDDIKDEVQQLGEFNATTARHVNNLNRQSNSNHSNRQTNSKSQGSVLSGEQRLKQWGYCIDFLKNQRDGCKGNCGSKHELPGQCRAHAKKAGSCKFRKECALIHGKNIPCLNVIVTSSKQKRN